VVRRIKWIKLSAGVLSLSDSAKPVQAKIPEDVTVRLRSLAHDLSNSLETILQASYLLGQMKLDPNGKKWAQLIDTATQDAARINREIRDILRSQG
jgi:signal transduction histidine kinase